MKKLLIGIFLAVGLFPAIAYTDIEDGVRVFLTRDPAGFVDGPNLYTYVKQNPWTAFDPEGLDAVYVVYPNEPITLSEKGGFGDTVKMNLAAAAYGSTIYRDGDKIKTNDIGHAGVLLVDPTNGKSNYYEYGRYDKDQKGVVREHEGPQMALDKDGHPTAEAMQGALKQLSDANPDNKGGKVQGLVSPSAKAEYDKQKAYADKRASENTDPNRTSYDAYNNSCTTFARDTINQGLPADRQLQKQDDRPKYDIGKQTNGTKVEYDPKAEKPAAPPPKATTTTTTQQQ